MRKFLFTVASAFMSFAAMAQHTVAPQSQRVNMMPGMEKPASEMMAAPSIMKSDQVSYLTKDCLFDTTDGEANAYSFMVFDYRLRTPSVVHFTTNDPLNYAMMVDYAQVPGQSIGVWAATFYGDKILAYCYKVWGQGFWLPYAWVTIDPKTGKYELLEKLPDAFPTVLSGMTYDPESKLAYAIEEVYEEGKLTGTNVYSIDPAASKLELKKIAFLKQRQLFTLSADKGYLYGISPVFGLDNATIKNSYLVKISISELLKGNVEIEEINKSEGLGLAINWAQAMDFDNVNHRLWWAAQTKDDSYFCEINTETGKLISKKKYDYTAQAVGLSIPHQYVNATAPSYVRNLKAKAAEEGVSTVTFSWTNPEVDFNLDPLKSLKSIKIIRDGEVVSTISATGAGKAQTYDDTNVPSGNHIYKIQTVNENGDGAYKEVQVFVGHDLPAGVTDIKVAAEGCKATITWKAPVKGVDGGWIDQTSLKYDVVRFPGNVKVASDITECTANDEVSESEGYYYEITSKNADGVGATVKSDITVFGPVQDIPFFTSLSTEEEFNRWSVIDNNNDLISWKFNKTGNVTCYERAVGPADDYLVTPAINFEAGKKYQVRFKYWTINWVEPSDGTPIYDKMDIYYAQEPTAAAFQKEGSIMDLGKFHTPSETYLYAKQVFTAQPGEGYVAFRAYSDADRSIIYLQDVCIREYSATDLSVTDLKGSIAAVQGTKSSYGVEVMNEGSAKVSNYTVELINKATGEVLASTEGVEINPEEKKIITIDWTPAEEGDFQVTARVNLAGDTYEADNTWNQPIEVTVSPSGSANWLSLNDDDSYDDEQGNWYNKGNDLPFNCSTGYSMAQCIYLDKELTKKNITITGIQFIYDGVAEGNFEKDVKISAMSADKDFFGWSSEDLMVESYDYEDENWITLYEGKMKFGGVAKNQKMSFDFSTYYYYTGGNLVFMYEKLWDENFEDVKAPVFHYHDIYDDGEDLRQRTCKFSNKYTDYPDPDKVGTFSFSPFTMLQYLDGDQSGIMGVTGEGLSFDIFGGKISMSEVCDSIVVYDIDGKVLAEAHNTNTVSVADGICIIKATAGNKTVNCKVTVK